MSVLIVSSNGDLIADTIQSYKSYGSLQHSWKALTHEIHLYAKKRGKAGMENKYEFPPPVDNVIYFGKCLLINPSGDLTIEMWTEFYDTIMQLENIEETESEEEDVNEGECSHGYLKDGFVVSDNELEEEAYKIDLKNDQME
jgi:hypothetical protein